MPSSGPFREAMSQDSPSSIADGNTAGRPDAHGPHIRQPSWSKLHNQRSHWLQKPIAGYLDALAVSTGKELPMSIIGCAENLEAGCSKIFLDLLDMLMVTGLHLHTERAVVDISLVSVLVMEDSCHIGSLVCDD